MRKISALLITITAALPVLGVAAQEGSEAPAPPRELARFDRLIGEWEGSGTAIMTPGAPEGRWTAKTRTRRAMNGFFLQEDTVIDLGAAAPGPLVFRSYFGYDSENKKYMACGVSNMHPGSASEIHWADADTMVTVETSHEEGQVVVDRWVTKLGSDSYSFVGHRAIGDGDFFVHIKGEMKRAESGPEGHALEAAAGFGPPAPEMKKLHEMAGHYRLKGTFQMMPETPEIQITASEIMVPIFGGSVLVAEVKGDPLPGLGEYAAWAAISWNPEKNCYTSIYVNNMGEIGQGEARWVGNDLVSTHSGLRMGQPSVGRGIMTIGADGSIHKITGHTLLGSHAPNKNFEASYTRQKH